jgi:hypothetical protein
MSCAVSVSVAAGPVVLHYKYVGRRGPEDLLFDHCPNYLNGVQSDALHGLNSSPSALLHS